MKHYEIVFVAVASALLILGVNVQVITGTALTAWILISGTKLIVTMKLPKRFFRVLILLISPWVVSTFVNILINRYGNWLESLPTPAASVNPMVIAVILLVAMTGSFVYIRVRSV